MIVRYLTAGDLILRYLGPGYLSAGVVMVRYLALGDCDGKIYGCRGL